jgi:hypothetical protein
VTAKAPAGKHRTPDTDRASRAAQAAGAYAATEKRQKPSVTKRAAGGAVSGAATGAALGSVVPGVGTAAGAAAGAVVGGASGARQASKDKRAARSTATRALIAEFVVCIVILALSPLSNEEGKTSPADWMKRGSAMCGLFLMLGLVSSIGPRAARAATAFGGLVTLVLAVDQRSVFGVLASRFATTGAGALAKVGPDDEPPPGALGKLDDPAGAPGKVERYVTE